MNKWILILVIIGILGSAVDASAVEEGKNVFKVEKGKPDKKYKKKKYTNKVVKKTKRNGNKF